MPLKNAARTATIIFTKNQPIEVFNAPVILGTSNLSSLNGMAYFKAPSNMTINKVELQLFAKGSATSGVLELDVLKSSSLSTEATTIMSVKPFLDMTTAVDYQTTYGTVNPALAAISEGNYIRLDLTSIPAELTSLHIIIYGTN
jgi:hypothetical protein